MRKLFAALAALLMLLSGAVSLAEPLALSDDLAGTYCWPEGSSEDTAVFLYRYCFPQVQGDGSTEENINAFYQYQLSDECEFRVAMAGNAVQHPELDAYMDIRYSVTVNDDRYFGVLLRRETVADGERLVIYSSQVFGRASDKPGDVLTLAYILGVLAEDSDDSWLQNRQTNWASECVRELVWEQAQRKASTDPKYAALTREDLNNDFYPEEDFYYDGELDALVFFLQPYMSGDEASDELLVFPLTVEEILDEL